MKEFKRGLDHASLESVKDFLSKDVGGRIVNNPNMNICIRNNYINIYLNGCSLLKYSPLAKANKQFLIHHKYLDIKLDDDSKDSYVSLSYEGKDLISECGKSFITNVMENPSEILKGYITDADDADDPGEKALLAKLISNAMPKPFLIDLEVAFTRKRTAEELMKKNVKKETVADRIDLAVLAKSNGRIILRMIEVKIDYDSRLKSREVGKQEVLKQMESYNYEFIGKQYENILKSYKKVAENYLKLGISRQFPGDDREDILKSFVINADESLASLVPDIKPGNNFALDMNPYLLIIRTDEQNMKGRNNTDHLENLQDQFCKRHYQPIVTWPNKENNVELFTI